MRKVDVQLLDCAVLPRRDAFRLGSKTSVGLASAWQTGLVVRVARVRRVSTRWAELRRGPLGSDPPPDHVHGRVGGAPSLLAQDANHDVAIARHTRGFCLHDLAVCRPAPVVAELDQLVACIQPDEDTPLVVARERLHAASGANAECLNDLRPQVETGGNLPDTMVSHWDCLVPGRELNGNTGQCPPMLRRQVLHSARNDRLGQRRRVCTCSARFSAPPDQLSVLVVAGASLAQVHLERAASWHDEACGLLVQQPTHERAQTP